MSASRSPQEWDEAFEYLVNMTLGLMALELGHQYLNRIDCIPMHTSVRTGHQYMLVSSRFIKPPNFDRVPDEIRSNPKYFPYFQVTMSKMITLCLLP